MKNADIHNLTAADLMTISDSDLDHLLNCQADADLMGNAWGHALTVEAARRRAQRVSDNEIADACIAALGDRGQVIDPLGDSLELFSTR